MEESILDGVIGKDVFEIACGSGDFAREVINRFYLSKIYGVDISEQAIKLAGEKSISGTCLNLDEKALLS